VEFSCRPRGWALRSDGTITCLPNQGYDAYRKTLTGTIWNRADVCPPPLGAAVRDGAPGVVVVTTTRPPGRLVSGDLANFVSGEPTLDGLAGDCSAAAR
jgi:hypothetical protein